MSRFRHHKYTWSAPFTSVRHNWEFVGPRGALNFHANISDTYPTSCGLEFHHAEPVGHYADEAPHHVCCPLIGGNCWHDGTSLYAGEQIWPVVESYLRIGDHRTIFNLLEAEYVRHFSEYYPALAAENGDR